MLHWLWSKIRFLLPFFILIRMYRRDKALPLAFATPSGNKYRAVMINENYGILICQEGYDPERLSNLKLINSVLEDEQKKVMDEINMLSFEQKEQLVDEMLQEKRKNAG